jgi:hypothetical protein
MQHALAAPSSDYFPTWAESPDHRILVLSLSKTNGMSAGRGTARALGDWVWHSQQGVPP